MNNFNADIVAINETWLQLGREACAPIVSGYRLYSTPRPLNMRAGRGGGVAFYVKRDVRIRIIKHPDANIEQMWLSIRMNGHNLVIGTAYRPHWIDVDTFLDALTLSVTHFSSYDHVVLLGDFNINMLDVSNNSTLKFKQFLQYLDLQQIITDPTHFSTTTETLIDLVCTDALVRQFSVNNITGSLGHAFICVELSLKKQKKVCRCFTYRPIKDIEMNEFNKDLNALDWESVSSLPTVDLMVNRFNSLLISLFDKHSGFRKGQCTVTSLLDVSDNILADQDAGQGTILALLDFSRAFKSLNIDLLLAKLEYYGLDSNSTNWFTSYLSGRSQSVKVKQSNGSHLISNAKAVLCGVPQGSVIGPLLFIIYTADLTKVIKHCRYQCYADDVQLYISETPDNIHIAIQNLNEDLNRIASWSNNNHLVLNPNKSKYLILGTKTQIDSEESDGEGGLGNLNRLIVRPPGQSGKAKRGQLCFDAAFECGNLGRADHITDLEYDLFIRPDTCRPRCRFWFNFTVENVRQDQRVIFNIVNLGKEYNLFNGDMTPLVRSTSRHKWQRLPRRLLFYHRSLAHRGRKILSIAFAFDREEDIYQFASAAPYSYSRLQRHLALWEKKAQAFATRQNIAQTTQKRRVELITIGNIKENVKDPKEEHITKGKVNEPKKRVVLIMSRTHGGEQPSSFICQGFLDYMVSSSEKASVLRNNIVLQVIPMLNPDGVFLGNQRSDLFGSDLNRCWHRATTFSHPALIPIKELVRKNTSGKDVQLDFIIDIHSDVSHEGVFVRGNSYDDVYRFERHAVLPKFLATRVEAWRQDACLYNSDPSVIGSARRTLPTGNVDAYTLVASMGGRRLTARGPYIHYTEDAYAKIGRSLAKALCDYYRHVGVIPPRVGLTKKKEPRGRHRRRRPPIERERSPSSSPERRVLAGRVVSPPLPAASPPPMRALPPRLTHSRHARHPAYGPTARQRTEPDVHVILPLVTGTTVRTPRLAVVDMSAYIRTPTAHRNMLNKSRNRLARPPRPSHPRYTSDEYETHESDS
ncbi:uncharacterized protein ACR2FA_001190 [Aphomia sociella]